MENIKEQLLAEATMDFSQELAVSAQGRNIMYIISINLSPHWQSFNYQQLELLFLFRKIGIIFVKIQITTHSFTITYSGTKSS